MNTKQKPTLTNCPSRATWAQELDSGCDTAGLVEHIEHCAACRRVIDELAAEPNLWQEAGDTLATKFPNLSHVTQSICVLADLAGQNSLSDSWHAHEITQLQSILLPASHPELLARIGRYELEQLIGRGGMGLVFRAWDTELHRVVAVKTLALALLPIGTARERFIREGRAAAMLNHPNIVPMYDVITEMPVPALVMQYIAGPTLESWIKEHGAMPWQDALRIGSQLCDALDAAHTGGLVHRDIKPSNVLLEADGTRPLLTDFGLVRAMDDAALTHSGMLAGTPHFMSPEQARGEEVDGRSDLFSLGSLLYFTMTGQAPFHAREPMAVLNRVCHQTQLPLCRVDREIPIEVSRLVDRLLEKQAAKRPLLSRDVRDELRALLAAPRRLRHERSTRSILHRRPMLASAIVSMCVLGALGWWQFIKPLAWSNSLSGSVSNQRQILPEQGEAGMPAHALAESQSSSMFGSDVAPTAQPTFDPSATQFQFTDMEQLAHRTAELSAMIDAHQDSLVRTSRDDSSLRQPFENLSRETASLEAELEQLRLSLPDSADSVKTP